MHEHSIPGHQNETGRQS